MSIGERIKVFRKQSNLTQKELATRTNVSPQVISNWERGYTSPSVEDIASLSKALNLNANKLLSTNESTSTNNKEISADDKTYDALSEINKLIKKYNIDQSGFFDIEKWKAMGPEEIRELESYFEFITSRAQKNKENEE